MKIEILKNIQSERVKGVITSYAEKGEILSAKDYGAERDSIIVTNKHRTIFPIPKTQENSTYKIIE